VLPDDQHGVIKEKTTARKVARREQISPSRVKLGLSRIGLRRNP